MRDLIISFYFWQMPSLPEECFGMVENDLVYPIHYVIPIRMGVCSSIFNQLYIYCLCIFFKISHLSMIPELSRSELWGTRAVPKVQRFERSNSEARRVHRENRERSSRGKNEADGSAADELEWGGRRIRGWRRCWRSSRKVGKCIIKVYLLR